VLGNSADVCCVVVVVAQAQSLSQVKSSRWYVPSLDARYVESSAFAFPRGRGSFLAPPATPHTAIEHRTRHTPAAAQDVSGPGGFGLGLASRGETGGTAGTQCYQCTSGMMGGSVGVALACLVCRLLHLGWLDLSRHSAKGRGAQAQTSASMTSASTPPPPPPLVSPGRIFGRSVRFRFGRFRFGSQWVQRWLLQDSFAAARPRHRQRRHLA
jgi:hypothetical protein